MNGVQTRFKCKLDVKRCKRFVFPPSSLLPRSNALKTKAIRYFQTDRTLTRIVSPPLKGKTTAAFGLAIRVLCAGGSVFIGQFVKNMKYNETKIEHLFNNVRIQQFGRGCFIEKKPAQEDIDAAYAGLESCKQILASGEYNLVVLDELTIALYYELLSIEEVLTAISRRHSGTELVITGRYAPAELIDIADLVTEMREVKHYYTEGVLSRNGIDR